MIVDAGAIGIRTFADISEGERAGVITGVERIFFAASNTQSFPDADTRATFRDVWLGHYLETYPHLFLVAFAEEKAVGYLAGCHVEPADDPHFAAHIYTTVFHDLWPEFPAHLHVNMDQRARSRGIGTLLVDDFVLRCRTAGLPGVHIVTGDGGRNNRFYQRCGFTHEVRRSSLDRSLVFMGRRLA